MSRGRNANNIRGPTSALTEFLRASGITPTTIARRAATRQQPDQAGQQDQSAAASSSSTPQRSEAEQPEASSSRRPSRAASARSARARTRAAASGYDSDNLDEEEAEAQETAAIDKEVEEEASSSSRPAKKRKLTKAAEAKLKAKQKKEKGSDGEDEDPYTSLSKSLWNAGGSKPPAGSFENCAKCGKQFTVTKYTMAAKPGPGWVCHACAKASGQDPFKKPAAPRKKKTEAEKREVIRFVENRMPTLVNLCIKIVTRFIDDVESLGDIGALNLEAIAKAMSKNRSLTPENAKLFYNATNTRLVFYDASNLSSPAMESLVFLNPNLTTLRLDFCGQLDDNAFKTFATSLPALSRIELLGPFLVRVPAWKAFAKAHPNLEGFLITQSPRFDLECMQTLIKHCGGLKELRLREVGKISDAFLEEISKLGDGLTYLDIGCPTESCSDDAMISLLREVGSSLQHLDITKHEALTDAFLSQGLLQHATNLDALIMPYLPELTDKGVEELFTEWANPPLVELNLARNDELRDAALTSIMRHSFKRLEVLNINGWKDVKEDGLAQIGKLGRELKKLDVGFCRAVDDFMVKAWLEGDEVGGVKKGGCRKLEELKVWGCNKLTERCPKKTGVAIHGVESHIIRTS